MATRGRRITIEVGGEDVGASKALRSTTGEADKLASKLKGAGQEAGRGLGEVGQEADQLAGKLKAAGKDAGTKMADGLKSGLAGVGSAVEGVGETVAGAISDGFDVDSIGDSLSGMLSGLGGKLGPAAAGVGVVVGGALAAGLINEFGTEAATDRLEARLGGGEWGKKAGEVAGDLYVGGFGDSIGDASDLVGLVMSSTLAPLDATESQLLDIANAAGTFSDVMGQDAAASVTAVDRMIAAGLVPNAEAGFDVLTTGLQQLGPAGEDLLDTFTEYSILFADLGLDAPAALGMIDQLMAAGVRNTDLAADALKEFGIRAQDGSESTVDAFESLGMNAESMMGKIAGGGPGAVGALNDVLVGLQGIEDPVERNRVGVELFGTQWEDMAGAIAGADLSATSMKLGDMAGSTDALGSAYDNASSKIEVFRRQAMEKLTSFVGDKVIPAVEGLSNWAKENPGAFQAIAAVVGGVLVVAFAAWAISAASAAVATIAATWPILAIAAAVALLVAGVIWAYQNWGWFRDACQAVADFVTGPLAGAFQWVWGVIQAVFGWVVDNWRLLVVILGGPIAWAAALIITHFSTIKNFIAGVISWIAGAIGWVAGVVTGAFGWAAGVAVGAWNTIWGAVSWVRDAIVGAVGWVRDAITGAFSWASGVANAAFYGLWYAFDWVVDQISGAVEWVKEKIAGVADAISNVPGAGVVKGLASHLPGFDVGGVVPGPVGSPQLAVVHGGETIFPTHNAAAMRAMAGEYTSTLTVTGGQDEAGDGGGPVIVNVSMAGAVIGSEAEATRWVAKAWNKAAAEGAINVRGRRL